ncbi:ArsR/SmtB family transcription factor [Candidatus Leptofilum sp.]|uniref:ArsR/SmtB family transcription factor n=1 Tax=Candidatus Leptofilum sp. TaxID=3241576 RepID=UPI003B59298F
MPAPTTDIVRKPQQATIMVALEPVYHLLNSLMLLNKSEYLSGYGEWVTQTAVSLSPQQLHLNKLVLLGLHYAIVPNRSWSSFEAYVDNLAAHDPVALRNKILDAYESLSCKPGTPIVERAQVLSSAEAYLDYLYGRFPDEKIDEAIEREAYALMVDPPTMQQTIVNHLREMWQIILKPEWQRIQPMLQTSVTAFAHVDFSGMTPLEAARTVVGQDLPEHWEIMLGNEKVTQVVFVPSAHIGPYLGTFKPNGAVWLIFGARLPEGTDVTSPDLSRSELLVRLNALADDTRLRILQIISEEGEQCSQDIINRLSLSQSAASRHLKQLSATGYLTERRRDGAKCYSLNPDRIEGILQALSYILKN